MRNLSVAARSIRRTPGFAAIAILTLALGIGLSTAVFTVAETLLLRDLPVRDQDGVVVLWGRPADGSFDNYPLEYRETQEFTRQSRTLETAALFAYEGAWPTPIIDAGAITRLRMALVSGEFFDVLGAQPVLGRALRPADDVAGAAPVVVLSHGAWVRQFGGQPDVLGKSLVIHGDGRSHAIVGVMPPGLDYPRGAEFWAPLVPAKTRPGTDSVVAHVDIIARLRSESHADAARDELTAFYSRTGASPWLRTLRGVATPLPRLVIGDARPALIAFSVAAALLLVITCINVANLLLVRGLTRLREIAVRSALGASRRQVIGQLLTENALLALAGGALGILVALAAVQAFIAFAPASVPRLEEIHVNAAAFGGAAMITGVAMLLFGLAPAIMASRAQPYEALRSGTRQSANRASRLATEALVAAQVALAVLVLFAAGLVGRSLIKLQTAELSFDASRLLLAELAFRYDRVADKQKQTALLDGLLPQLRAVPGIVSVSPVVAVPFAGSGGWDGRLAAEGQTTDQAAANPVLNIEVVVPDYFRTFGMSLVRGRFFTDADRDGAMPVVIVSQSTARHYWPGQDAVGKRMQLGRNLERSFTVVGVVPDTRYRELRDARPSVYFPLGQSFFPFAPLTLAMRTSGDPAAMVPAVRRAIDAVDPGVALASASPFETYMDKPLAQPRLNALLLAIFSAAAVALAAIGLFAIMATLVRQRTREIGVRMALGATASDLRRMVLGRGLAIAMTGLTIGLIGCMLANRLLTSLLYEVSSTDGLTLALVSVLLLLIAGVATALPARASTRVDPVVALRSEA
jgi:putative ABC transport system permease protein